REEPFFCYPRGGLLSEGRIPLGVVFEVHQCRFPPLAPRRAGPAGATLNSFARVGSTMSDAFRRTHRGNGRATTPPEPPRRGRRPDDGRETATPCGLPGGRGCGRRVRCRQRRQTARRRAGLRRRPLDWDDGLGPRVL